jgi:FMN phosphatase YigB (HAD superfamily)
MDIDLQKIRAVIFDFDGTLYDNRNFPFWLIINNLRDTFVCNAERKVRKQMKGVDLDNAERFYNSFFSLLSDKTRFSEEEAKEWYWDTYMEAFTEILNNHCTPYKDVEIVFSHLKKLGVATAIYSDYPLVKERVEALGLSSEICENYWAAPELGAFKPAIRPMQEIATELGISPNEMLIVGDRVDTDGKSAFAVGAQFIHIEKKKNKVENDEYVSLHWNEFVEFIQNWEY